MVIKMGKQKRGRAIKKIANWKGTCPLCKRAAVKLLWDKTVNGVALKVCKVCGNKK